MVLWFVEGCNNYFLLFCIDDWKGVEKFYDGYCFRQYENVWISFRDYSFFIIIGLYSDLKILDMDDICGWVVVLEDKGFLEEFDFVVQLFEVIWVYGLQLWGGLQVFEWCQWFVKC